MPKVAFIMHRAVRNHPNTVMTTHTLNCRSVTDGGVGSLCHLPNNRDRQENQHVTPLSAGSPTDLTCSRLFSVCAGFAWLLKIDWLSGWQTFSD